jgi:hypothetical protein
VLGESPPFAELLSCVEPLPCVKPVLLAELAELAEPADPVDPSETVVVVAATGLPVWLPLAATAATMAMTMTAAALPQKIGL